MSGFQLDTSGTVPFLTVEGHPDAMAWSDLDAFTQGYIEALFAGANLRDYRPGGDIANEWVSPGFSDLAPETLAQIIEDCERFGKEPVGEHGLSEAGITFWQARQWGYLRHDKFPPLTVTLGDDGKVRFAALSSQAGVG